MDFNSKSRRNGESRYPVTSVFFGVPGFRLIACRNDEMCWAVMSLHKTFASATLLISYQTCQEPHGYARPVLRTMQGNPPGRFGFESTSSGATSIVKIFSGIIFVLSEAPFINVPYSIGASSQKSEKIFAIMPQWTQSQIFTAQTLVKHTIICFMQQSHLHLLVFLRF